MKILAAVFLYAASAAFVFATFSFVKARKRLSAPERESLRSAGGRVGRVAVCLWLPTLAASVLGIAYFGVASAPFISLPLFAAVFASEVLEVVHVYRSEGAYSQPARRAILVPGYVTLFGVVLWTLGCVSYLAAL